MKLAITHDHANVCMSKPDVKLRYCSSGTTHLVSLSHDLSPREIGVWSASPRDPSLFLSTAAGLQTWTNHTQLFYLGSGDQTPALKPTRGLPDIPPHMTSHSEETRTRLLPRPDMWVKRKDGLAASAIGKAPDRSHPHTIKPAEAGSTHNPQAKRSLLCPEVWGPGPEQTPWGWEGSVQPCHT